MLTHQQGIGLRPTFFPLPPEDGSLQKGFFMTRHWLPPLVVALLLNASLVGGWPVSEALAAMERREVLSDTGLRVVNLGPQGGELHVKLSEDGVALLRAPATGESPRRLGLVIADVQLVHPDAYFAVYLNLPKGTAPDFTSIYYVGNIALFGPAQHTAHGTPGSEFMFDVTDTVRALQERGKWRDDFTLTFVRDGQRAAAPAPNEPPVFLRVGRILLIQF